ncbi:MAG: hypothetical protein HZB51_10485 [Chloroflexi bacterium]|nr:hypothetical protein [Chloroflexota bacterium]
MNKPTVLLQIGFVVMVGWFVSACNIVGASNKPTIVIRAPASNSVYEPGDQVAISSTSTDTVGITRVELHVDGTLVAGDQVPTPQQNLAMIQTWTAVTGTHTLEVRSINANGAVSDPAAVVIRVGATPVGARSSAATTTSSAASAVPSPAICQNVAFVADVTVPDGMVIAPGTSMNKIWRVRNTGSCAWTPDDSLVFARGEMAASSKAIALPSIPPGETVDLMVPFTAPTAAGKHQGEWRFKNKSGALFGTPLTIVVNVNPPSVSTPSATVNPCPFTPVIESFTAAPTSIIAGQTVTLRWGAVVGAQRAEIDNGIGGVATPGSMNVTPQQTTTYTLTATCNNKTRTATVTIDVRPAQ